MSNAAFIATVISLSVFMLGTVVTLALVISANLGNRINDLIRRFERLEDKVEQLHEDVVALKATS